MSRVASFRLPALVQDVALAAFVTVTQVQGVATLVAADPNGRPLTDVGNLGLILLVVPGVALVVRRRWPVTVLLVAAVASVVYYLLDFRDGPGWLALFVALYTVTAHGDGRRSLAIAGGVIVVLSVAWLNAAQDIQPPAAIGWVFFRIGASVMSGVLGESVRTRRFIAAEAVERAEFAERTREDEARARVDAERLRIAREVHDTVAHAIAIINVQAGVTAHVLDKRPERARETLKTIEQTSSQALREMRTILGVLRDGDPDGDPDDGRAPHPDLQDIDQVIDAARDAGLDVEVEATPSAQPVPSAVASAAYRILQESITNVIRHVGPTRVTVSVGHGADELEVRVVDEGPRDPVRSSGGVPADPDDATTARPEPGRGIRGMRERCQLLGGELTARPRPDGGFEVRARLPLAPAGAMP